ncbi:hypothetical protein AMELA_G00154510 [Ameiurus melas]|uniref:Uncharacterized protein n=1 Tax=Ameiurus melas TaxID=219545 RepID=A0A7J6AKS7_AMEME|nr:hypothetical protein AMELA_G00154510 [Ameiurus melas]
MSHSDGESQRSVMEKEEPRCSPSPPSTPSICSPTSSASASSVPSTGKNVCASCGLEILDRYLLKELDLCMREVCCDRCGHASAIAMAHYLCACT